MSDKLEQTEGQLAYQNWVDNPPKFYCFKHGSAQLPPEDTKKAREWYCSNQCFNCMAVVGERRKKTQEIVNRPNYLTNG